MTKKRVLKYSLIAVAAVVVFISIFLVYISLTSFSYQDCIDYCIENSQRGATIFMRIGDSRHIREYAYFIAADGDPSKPQEMFVFREKKYSLTTPLDRYEFIMSTTQENVNSESGKGYGSLRFFAKNDHDETEKGATLIYFGASKESDIFWCDYTVTILEGSLQGRAKVLRGDDNVWFTVFYDLCTTDDTTKKDISDVSFSDIDGNPIE